ncbi:MAG: hypothetical protein H6832_02960 [Planctomycetes bacterium]|nr:hypothetical protein [Planctomycetota bacterium]MCB9917342.1 hypothetical protein [Planctomycetota bacterium]
MRMSIRQQSAVCLLLAFAACNAMHDPDYVRCRDAVLESVWQSDFERGIRRCDEAIGARQNAEDIEERDQKDTTLDPTLLAFDSAMLHLMNGEADRAYATIEGQGRVLWERALERGAKDLQIFNFQYGLDEVWQYATDEWALPYDGLDYEHAMHRVVSFALNLATEQRYNVFPLAQQAQEVNAHFAARYAAAPGASTVVADATATAEGPAMLGMTGAGLALAGLAHESLYATEAEHALEAYRNADAVEGGANEFVRAQIERLEEALQQGDFDGQEGFVWCVLFAGLGPSRVAVQDDELRKQQWVVDLVLNFVSQLFRDKETPAWARAIVPTLNVRMPSLARHMSDFDEIEVSLAGGPWQSVPVAFDFEALAMRNFERIRSTIAARTIIRRTAKKIAAKVGSTVASKELVKEPGFWQTLVDSFGSAVGSVWSESEVPDLRNWTLMPARLHILRLPVAQGRNIEVRVRAKANGAVIEGSERALPVEVWRQESTFVVGHLPEATTRTKLMTSRHVDELRELPPERLAHYERPESQPASGSSASPTGTR